MMTDIGINNITIDEAKLSSFRGAAGGEGCQNTFIKNERKNWNWSFTEESQSSMISHYENNV